MDHETVTSRIEAIYPDLSRQLQHAARFVLDRPDDVALNSMRQAAALAGVHPSTMVRLARRLGWSSYIDFKRPFRQRLRQQPANYVARARHLQRGMSEAADLLQEIRGADVANIRDTFDGIGPDHLAACGQLLAGARRIYVAGLRHCYPVAFFFQYACRMFRDNVVLLDDRGGTFADDLRDLTAEDVLLAISFTPYTRNTVNALRYAAGRRATVIALTDSAVSPLAREADRTLVVANASPSFFQSLVGAMAVAQALVALLVAHGGDQAIDLLEETTRQLTSFDAYWPDTPGRRAAG